MKNLTKYYFVSIGIVFLLNGCQKDISALPPMPLEKQEQSAIIEKCLTLNKTEPDTKFAYLDDKKGWYPVSEDNKDLNISRGLSLWTSDNAKEAVLENSTPSGDWYRIDEYCFNEDNNIAELYSDLRTSYGNVQAIRSWRYYSDGSLESDKTELFDLNTKKPISLDEASYMDNPPKLVKNYAELAQYLELPAMHN